MGGHNLNCVFLFLILYKHAKYINIYNKMIFDYYQFMLNFMLSVNDALIVLLLFIRLNF